MTDSEKILGEIFGAGTDILDSVDRAITTGDFSQLNEEINRTVNQVSRSVQEMNERYRKQGYYTARPNQSGVRVTRRDAPDPQMMDEMYRRRQEALRQRQAMRQQQDYARQQAILQQREAARRQAIARSQASRTPFRQGRVSQMIGIGRIIAGSIVTSFCGLLTAAGFSMLFDGDILAGLFVGMLFGAGLGAGIYNIVKGAKDRKLLERYNQYANIIGTSKYYAIDQLARAVRRDRKDVVRDLHAMIARGFLPNARIDATESTLMLTDDVYQQYLAASRNLRMQQEDAMRREAEEAGMSTAERTYRKVVSDGEAYIETIRRVNQSIPDGVMSDKLDRLESIMQRIFEQVKDHPESAADLRRLMDYYLPTINKLLDSYVELDRQPELENGTYIRQTKDQITGALDTINDAFESLLDNMFQNMAWDVSSDISVMKTMLAQDGLTTDDIRRQRQQMHGFVPQEALEQPQTVPPQPQTVPAQEPAPVLQTWPPQETPAQPQTVPPQPQTVPAQEPAPVLQTWPPQETPAKPQTGATLVWEGTPSDD